MTAIWVGLDGRRAPLLFAKLSIVGVGIARLLETRQPGEVVAMVDKKQVQLTILASVVLVGVPLIANAIHDLVSGRWDEQIADREGSDAEAAMAAPHSGGRPIEQLAADLRRLRAAVASDQHRSATHQLANRVAYDQLLMQACAMLEVQNDLGKKTVGRERDIERIRVEAELERAGIVLTAPGRYR